MIIENHKPLKTYNTFAIEVWAKQMAQINNPSELSDLFLKEVFLNKNPLVLGGGSNILFTKNYPGLVLFNNIQACEVLWENKSQIALRIGSGMGWQDFVVFCIQKGYGGVENLSLIPGTVGAAPIQNIGAYGVEVKSVIDQVCYFEFETGLNKTISNIDCGFSYRDSVFKNALKGKVFITHVDFILSVSNHVLHLDYGDIQKELVQMGVKIPDINSVSVAVQNIRKSKLPDPKILGNGGSFFKNPVVTKSQFNDLQLRYPAIPHYVAGENQVKIPAGWLIDFLGWKGKRKGAVGVHENQALVLVNYGNATGKEVFALSQEIILSVKANFDITLEREVWVI